MDDLTLHPAWKNAVRQFELEGLGPGDVLTMAMLEAWGGPVRPKRGTYEEIKSYDLKFLQFFDSFRDTLMRNNNVLFGEKEKNRGGWVILAPHEVAAYSRRQSERGLRKAIEKQRRQLAYTDLSALTPKQLRDHAETQVRCSWKSRALREVETRVVQLPELPRPLPRRKT